MTNNDILSRICCIFDLTNSKLIDVFAAAEYTVTQQNVVAWLTNADDKSHKPLTDNEFANFLNGYIVTRRGRREGAMPVAENKLNNNIIFMKLRIALNLQADDVLAIFSCVDYDLSKYELSAFSRKEGNKHYRVCNDQVLRFFLLGLEKQNCSS